MDIRSTGSQGGLFVGGLASEKVLQKNDNDTESSSLPAADFISPIQFHVALQGEVQDQGTTTPTRTETGKSDAPAKKRFSIKDIAQKFMSAYPKNGSTTSDKESNKTTASITDGTKKRKKSKKSEKKKKKRKA
eukprot:g2517.t1